MNFSVNLPASGPGNYKRVLTKADVRLTLTKGKRGNVLAITFKNSTFPEMEENNVVLFEPRGERLYFGFADAYGYRLQRGQRTSYVQLAAAATVKKLQKYIGEFKAQRDSEENCYYIELEEVPEKTLFDVEDANADKGNGEVLVFDDTFFNELEERITKSISSAFASAAPELSTIIKNAVRQGFEEVK